MLWCREANAADAHAHVALSSVLTSEEDVQVQCLIKPGGRQDAEGENAAHAHIRLAMSGGAQHTQCLKDLTSKCSTATYPLGNIWQDIRLQAGVH